MKKFSKYILSTPFIIGMLYHLIGLIGPALVEPSSAERHLLFLGINLTMAALAWFQTKIFFYPLLLLSIQQFYSHISYALLVHKNENRIDWYSVIVVLALALLLFIAKKENSSKNK